ncbi:phenoloxidase-activating factor 2-like [Drosophila teissieri]|uniref:phenoloxidase-activating factor 2-like n=1 Tax=Drosophila teissieri TaxID=7243 RepID=UPI001CBA02AA|nr:phenoloxidase-activating factor 2-like [Drosophila teissieri]
MIGFLRLLVLLCAASMLSAQTSEEPVNANKNIDIIFGANQPGQRIKSDPDNIKTPPPIEVRQSGVDASNCECVPYNKCDTPTEGITQNIPCGFMELCCPHHRLRTTTLNSTSKPNRGCGTRNVGGLVSDIKYDITQYESDYGEFPWTVAILQSGDYSFTGTLIHPRVVLTAAHQIKDGQIYSVRAGEWDIKSTNERLQSQELEVERVIKHPALSKSNFQYDVAILILEQSFSLEDHINVICLPDNGAAPPLTSECYVNGWANDAIGNLDQYDVLMNRLPYRIMEFSECHNRLRNILLNIEEFYLSPSIMCAETQTTVSLSKGYGGAPLACPFGDPSKNRYQLSGIMSFHYGYNYVSKKTGFVNVASVRNWIDQEMTANGFDKSYYTA